MVVLHANQVRALAKLLRGYESGRQLEIREWWEEWEGPRPHDYDDFSVEVRICGEDKTQVVHR